MRDSGVVFIQTHATMQNTRPPMYQYTEASRRSLSISTASSNGLKSDGWIIPAMFTPIPAIHDTTKPIIN